MLFEPKVNVLLVDDHPENLLALEAILDSLGQNLVRATSGAEALRNLLNQDFAVILLDVQMPDMDGFETAALIRQRERSRHTPIIFVTAFNTSDNMVFRGYSLGAVDYLFKPIEPEILKSKVAAFIDLFQKSAEVKRQAAQLAAMNAELKKREEMFRSLSACSPVGIFLTDAHGKCTYANPRYHAIFGLTPEQSLDEGWIATIHHEEQQSVVANWYAAAEGRGYKGEFRIITPAGIERWVYMSSSPMLSEEGNVIGFTGTSEDITERKKAEEEHIKLIREQTARQEAETANRLKDEFLATLSHELRTPLTSILGWARLLRQRKLNEEAITRAIETIERNADLQAQLIEDILDVSRIMRGKLTLNICPVNLVSLTATVVNSIRLEAEAKKIQLEYVVELNETENTATQRRDDIENKEDVGMRVHGETTNTDEILSPSPPLPVTASSVIVSGDPNRLQQVLWNLLNNAIKFTPSDGRVEVRLEVVNDWEIGRTGDGEKVESTSPHHPTTPPPHHKNRYAQITITDTGVGISPEFLPYVFDRFRQADGSITRNHGGLGLGLAIVRYLVEMHSGSVHADSPGVGQGATFSVKLPLLATQQAPQDQESKNRECAVATKAEGNFPKTPVLQRWNLKQTEQITKTAFPNSVVEQSLSGLQVLVVDGDTDTREYVTTVLQESGAEVTAIDSVQSALLIIAKSLPDVLISDISMPEEDGYTLIRKIRNLQPEQGRDLPAIALTAYARPQDCQQALDAGFQMYVSKPVEPNQLIHSVAKLMQRLGRGS
ncbi:response regulator [Fischerella thermalis]|uniref:hybrid sensor histidine kinase/response regulator n=5 Tax=Fischerella thermalis TaxID=372787 RepID=UPI000C80A4C7|nr:response regulator [Fischerella thermalis]PLZ39049.1 hybrid sensor histidine kinase/response regulator [Fischerella thermalis WC527]PLZ45925.1 hybrid sensor histidine kinase/response regulator [Fischerella thermalis WC538]PLZ58811.1 hybrid sensor histidine kinase/response regulator [Fischerella thermalis WC344]PLZ67669.1 hybrid sensor histidine kinase/response regulator [Fischerella thermalis WC246]PLZ73677.1 hybrid sensor histidine kinase/response regulator [Fischerella thermalis WC245]